MISEAAFLFLFQHYFFPKAVWQAATHRDTGICPDYVLTDTLPVFHIMLSNYILKTLPALPEDPHLHKE